MIRAIANQRLDLSEDELAYYRDLEQQFGQESFRNLFKTDKNGFIVSVMPNLKIPTPMPVIFFMFNVMFNQRLRVLDQEIIRIKSVAREVDGPNIIERLEEIEKRIGTKK